MIDLRFYIMRPKFLSNDLYRNIFDFSKKLTENKAFEAECFVCNNSQNIVEFEIDLHLWGKDHAGPSVCFALFGLHLGLSLYDIRHWNYTTNTWEVEGDQHD